MLNISHRNLNYRGLKMSEELFRHLTKSAEKFLKPLGVWPSQHNKWITISNIVILTGYSILVIIKNLKNPERESIENAFTLANGGLITVAYFITILLKKEKCSKLYEYIISDNNYSLTNVEKIVVVNVGKEFQKISRAFIYFLFASISVRFLLPTAEYSYSKVKP